MKKIKRTNQILLSILVIILIAIFKQLYTLYMLGPDNWTLVILKKSDICLVYDYSYLVSKKSENSIKYLHKESKKVGVVTFINKPVVPFSLKFNSLDFDATYKNDITGATVRYKIDDKSYLEDKSERPGASPGKGISCSNWKKDIESRIYLNY